jgi:uncharacterized protein
MSKTEDPHPLRPAQGNAQPLSHLGRGGQERKVGFLVVEGMNLDRSILSKLTEPLPFIDLFEELRRVGMQLTLRHYDLLQRALWRSYVVSWEDLRRVCMVLWVKPSDNYDENSFDRVFGQYQRDCEALVVEDAVENLELGTLTATKSEILPEVPVRLMPERVISSSFQGPIGVAAPAASNLKLSGKNWKFSPIDLPLSVVQLQKTWRRLRRVQQNTLTDEIDLERTVEQISRVGIFADVVLKSAARQRSELIVLVDDKAGMLPYFPALQPLFQAIEGGWVSPARLYRFTAYPTRFLYSWKNSEPIGVDGVLAQLHQTGSIVLVVSDGGAVSGAANADRVQGTANFLNRWWPCVAQIIWLNPVPELRWTGTPAAEIRELMSGQMVSLEGLAQPLISWGHR